MSNREDILANFQVRNKYRKLITKLQLINNLIISFSNLQQITEITDIELAIAHLESTNWDLEVIVEND